MNFEEDELKDPEEDAEFSGSQGADDADMFDDEDTLLEDTPLEALEEEGDEEEEDPAIDHI